MQFKDQEDDNPNNIPLEDITGSEKDVTLKIFSENDLKEANEDISSKIHAFGNTLLEQKDPTFQICQIIDMVSTNSSLFLSNNYLIGCLFSNLGEIDFRNVIEVILVNEFSDLSLHLLKLIQILSEISVDIYKYISSVDIFTRICECILACDDSISFNEETNKMILNLLKRYYSKEYSDDIGIIFENLSSITSFFNEFPLMQLNFLRFVVNIPETNYPADVPRARAGTILRCVTETNLIFDELLEDEMINDKTISSLCKTYILCLQQNPKTVISASQKIQDCLQYFLVTDIFETKINLVLLITEYNMAISKIDENPKINISGFMKNHISLFIIKLLSDTDKYLNVVALNFIYSVASTNSSSVYSGLSADTLYNHLLGYMSENTLEQKVISFKIIATLVQNGDYTLCKIDEVFLKFLEYLCETTSLMDIDIIKSFSIIISGVMKFYHSLSEKDWKLFKSHAEACGIKETLEDLLSEEIIDSQIYEVLDACYNMLIA